MALDPTKIQRFAKDLKKVPKELKEFYDLAENHEGACLFQIASRVFPRSPSAGTLIELRGLYIPKSEQNEIFKQLNDIIIDIRDRDNADNEMKSL